MTEINPSPSKIIPNSFQKPNWIVDVVMRYLPGEHYKCLDVVVRKTLGWLKEKDRISTSQIVELSGLSERTVYKCMRELVGFGLIEKTDGNNSRNQGNEWALQMDDRLIDLSGLMAWDGSRRAVNQRRTRAASSNKGVLSCDDSTHTRRQGGTVVARQTQKPLSKAIKDSLSQREPNFSEMSVLEARRVPTLQAYANATGFFPGAAVWEYVHRFISEHGVTEDQIRSAFTAWKLRGHRSENIEGILEWARDGIPQSGQKRKGAQTRSKNAAAKSDIIDGVLANGY